MLTKKTKIFYAVLLLAAIGGAGYFAKMHYFKPADPMAIIKEKTAPIAAEIMKEVVAPWNYDAMKPLEHPQLSPAMEKAGKSFAQFFGVFSKLGKPTGKFTCTFLDGVLLPGGDDYALANYGCNGVYENGEASIYLQLVKNDDTSGKFLIGALRVNSPFFKTLSEQQEDQRTGNQ